jgi:membrane fusion protein (multidrug efflux system)
MATAENTNAKHPDNNPRKRKSCCWPGADRDPQRRGVWGWHELYGRFNESTDDAYVNGNVVEITPLVTGTVVSIGADDGDLVHEGQVLVNFDPNDAEVGLQSAQANWPHRASGARPVQQRRRHESPGQCPEGRSAESPGQLQPPQEPGPGGAISQEELSHARDT